MDSLVELITEMVMKELDAAKGGGPVALSPRAPSSSGGAAPQGARLLVVPGPEVVGAEVWAALAAAKVRPRVLVGNGLAQDLPGTAAGWPQESRDRGWSKVVTDYAAVVLLGSDLPTLGSLAGLGAGGSASAGLAVAAVAAGLPIYCESSAFEGIRRHSARLAPGFVQTFETAWRTASSFGIEFGGAPELGVFLARLGAGGTPTASAAKNGSRDVVTTEDVEAAKRAGQKQLLVGMGAIVTPLARQQATELGIEVLFQ